MTVNASTFRLVAGFLGVAFLGLIAAISVLAGLHDDIPTILENLATGALTALAALLVSPHNPDEPTPVTVTDQPVAVTERKTATRRRARGDTGLTGLGIVLAFVILLIALSMGAFVHPLFFLLVVLCLVVLL